MKWGTLPEQDTYLLCSRMTSWLWSKHIRFWPFTLLPIKIKSTNKEKVDWNDLKSTNHVSLCYRSLWRLFRLVNRFNQQVLLDYWQKMCILISFSHLILYCLYHMKDEVINGNNAKRGIQLITFTSYGVGQYKTRTAD